MAAKHLIIGGAGFIGSHVGRALVARGETRVVIFDNFSSGKFRHFEDIADRVEVIRGDVKDLDALTGAMRDTDVVYHFASNPDIARAVTDPSVDFWEGTYLTHNVAEAARRTHVPQVLYASGSGVYGDTGSETAHEDHAPNLPISTYAASKLAGESLFCAYGHMFDFRAIAFRFANVVGPNQTHGVGYDFVRRLRENPRELSILGDGTQSKSYIYVTDVVDAMLLAAGKAQGPFAYFNVATLDCITVTEIADLVCGVMGFRDVKYRYAGGDRGWKGDVPVVRLASAKIRALGWQNRYTSREAMQKSVESMLEDADKGRRPEGATR